MLIGERVRLRAVERADLPHFVEWFNDPEVRHNLARFAPMSLADEERWFERNLDRTDHYVFAMEIAEGGGWTMIGNCGIDRLDQHNRSACLGIMIGIKAQWGHGYGTEAMRLLVRFGFDELNLNRIWLDVYEGNRRAQVCYEKCGFRTEGVKREAVYHSGSYHDVYLMAILREEYDQLKRAGRL